MTPAGVWWIATMVSAAAAVPPVPIDPESLHAPLAADRAGADLDATLARRIKAEPTSLNPLLMFTAVDAEFDYLLWDRPFLLDENLAWKLNPAVAEGYVETADRTEAVLTLKAGLTWHDGAPFTSADLVFSWQRIMDERAVCRKARTGADQLAGVDALTPRKVRFRFKEPLPTNKWNVDFPIIPRHVYLESTAADPTMTGSDANVEHNRQPVGNGPYRFVEWADGQRIVLERWDDYRGPQPALKRIVFKVVPDNNAALLAFEAGEIDEMELTPQQFALETGGPRFAEVGVKGHSQQWTTYYIGWNVDGSVPFLADVKVRQALCQALDLSRVIDRVFFGLFTPSRGLFHAGMGVPPSAAPAYPFDPRAAAALLDEAGWYRDGADGWRYKSVDGQRVRAGFVLNLVQGSQTSPKIADLYQAELRKLGVDMSARVLDWSVFNERNFKHEFAAYLSAWTPGPEPDEAWNLLHSSARDHGRNYVGYANPEVDSLFAKARAEFDPEARMAYYRRIDDLVYADAPYTFLVNAPTLWAFSNRLRGVSYSPRGPVCFYPGVLAWWKPCGP